MVTLESAIYISNSFNLLSNNTVLVYGWCTYPITKCFQFHPPVLYSIAVIHFTYVQAKITEYVFSVIVLNKLLTVR